MSLFSVLVLLAQGKLEFTTKTIDFGKIDKSAPLRFSYTFKNVGDLPIEISKITYFTSYVKVNYSHSAIQPNESGTIDVYYDVISMSPRKFIKPLFEIVTSNQEKIRLSISGEMSDAVPTKQERCQNNGFTWYRIYENGKYGVQNKDGHTIIKSLYQYVDYTKDRFIAKDEKVMHWFSLNGKHIFSLECDNFLESMDLYKVEYNKEYAIYDKTGKCIIPFSLHCTDIFAHYGFYLARRDTIYAVYDKTGKCIIPFERQYTEVDFRSNKEFGDYFYVGKTNHYAMCNTEGKELFTNKVDFNPYYVLDRFVFITKTKSDYCDNCYNYNFNDISGKIIHSINNISGEFYITIYTNGDIILTPYIFTILKAQQLHIDLGKDVTLGNIQNYIGKSRNPMK